MSQRAGALAFVFCAHCLSGVFDEKKIPARGNLKKRVHVRHLAEQMNRDNGAGPRGDDGFDPGRVQSIGQRVDINKDRPCSEAGNTPD